MSLSGSVQKWGDITTPPKNFGGAEVTGNGCRPRTLVFEQMVFSYSMGSRSSVSIAGKPMNEFIDCHTSYIGRKCDDSGVWLSPRTYPRF